MKITSVHTLAIPDIKIITFKRFSDVRGYFTETYRKSDLANDPQTEFLKDINFTQANESYSKKGVVRGLHFQWDPFMAKLVRVVRGTVIDLALDIRQGSPTFGKIVGHKLESHNDLQTAEWIWVPVGFAHGLLFPEEGIVEYFCTGEWSPQTEAGISPLATDIDWSLCNSNIKKIFDEVTSNNPLISDKDRDGHTLEEWKRQKDSINFKYQQ